ncbi:MAG: hypothetical protein P8M73_08380 [Luminiphilus sp.]|jgi:hypothetical protein|nr:hypothetical protein [Luminiphilus sp.]
MPSKHFFPLSYLPLLLALGGCAALTSGGEDDAPTRPENGWQPCEGERPRVCTMIYDPVCGRRDDGTVADYASPCNACADVSVTAWHPQTCEE